MSTMMLLAVTAIYAAISSVNGFYDNEFSDDEHEFSTVAFSASILQTQSIEVNQIVKYPNVFINFGNAYNSDTGVFTAPMPGVYVFYIHALSTPESFFDVQLFHNETPTVAAFEGKGDWRSGGNTVILELNYRDRIYVKTYRSSVVFGKSFSTFSGYLISN